MPASRIPGAWVTALRMVAGLLLLGILLALVDLGEIWTSLRHASVPLMALSLFLFTLQCLPESIRLKVACADWNINLLTGLRLYLVGLFFNNFTPGVIGADLYQVQQLHSIRPGLLRPLSVLLFLRATSLLVNLSLALVIIALGAGAATDVLEPGRPGLHVPDGIAVCLGAILGLLAALLALFVLLPRGRKTLRSIGHRLGQARIEVMAAMRALSIGAIAAIIGHGFISVALRAASLYVLLLALGGQASAADVLLAVTVAIIVLVIPLTFAGVGVREAAISTVLIAAGTEAYHAVAAALIGRFFIWLLSLPGGAWFVSRSNE